MANLKYSVGIDIGKEDFKACFVVIDDQQKVTVKSSGTFKNNKNGFEGFSTWIKKHHQGNIPCRFLMEATGIYYEQLAWFLYNKDYKISVILPNKAKKYIQGLGIKSKNDKIDAKGLAHMGAQQSLELWQPLSKNIYTLRALTRLHEDLTIEITSLKNRLEALDCSMFKLSEPKKSLQKLIDIMKKELKKIENEIQKTVKDDPLLNNKCAKITATKGVGLLTFAVIISETNGFTLFTSISQLTSYAGYDVVENQSGKKKGKTKISKRGNAHIRRILHMPAFNVVKYEPSFKTFFKRVYGNTNMKMKAYVAVQRRLLSVIYALWKKDVAFDSNYSEAGAADPLWGDSEGIKKSQALGALAH